MVGAGRVTDALVEPAATTLPELPELRLRLPGSWWNIPLTDLEEAKASIRRLVDRAAGSRDDRAADRERYRRQLLDAAEAAIAGSGRAMHIALEIVEGLPIPVSVTVFAPDMRLTPAIGTDGLAVMAILEKGLARAAETPADPDAAAPPTAETRSDRFRVGESEVLRRLRHETTTYGDEQVPGLAVDYWITVPGAKRVALLSFSTALTGMDDIMLGFFDSIVQASFWQAKSPAS